MTSPTIKQLFDAGHVSLDTLNRLFAIELKRRLQDAGLRAMCLGSVPARRGRPATTIATTEPDIITT